MSSTKNIFQFYIELETKKRSWGFGLKIVKCTAPKKNNSPMIAWRANKIYFSILHTDKWESVRTPRKNKIQNKNQVVKNRSIGGKLK